MEKRTIKLKIPRPAWYFFYIVLCPTILATIYYGLFASDIYISEARYSIRSNSSTGSSSLISSVISGNVGGGNSTNEDAQIVKDYSLSHSMLALLDERLELRKHYSSKNTDFLSRLSEHDSSEDFLEYFNQMAILNIDSNSGITTLRVRAFSPEMAAEIARTMISTSEGLVNQISERVVDDFLKFARDEVVKAEVRIKSTSQELTNFRSENRSIDPSQETSAVLGIVTGLETTLAAARTELLEAKSFLQTNSLQIKVLESKVEAIREQVFQERTRLSNEGSIADYTQLIDRYEPLILEQQLAKEFYTSALSSLEIARAEAQRKQRYLISFVEPKISDEAVEPRRIYAITTVFMILLVAFAIGSLIWAAIKDHMRI